MACYDRSLDVRDIAKRDTSFIGDKEAGYAFVRRALWAEPASAIESCPIGALRIQPIALAAFTITDKPIFNMAILAGLACKIPLSSLRLGLLPQSSRSQFRAFFAPSLFRQGLEQKCWGTFRLQFTFARGHLQSGRLAFACLNHGLPHLLQHRVRFDYAAAQELRFELYPLNAVTITIDAKVTVAVVSVICVTALKCIR